VPNIRGPRTRCERPDETARSASGWLLRRSSAYAAEASNAVASAATEHRLGEVVADTTLENIASHRALTRAGFSLGSIGAELHHCEQRLSQDPA